MKQSQGLLCNYVLTLTKFVCSLSLIRSEVGYPGNEVQEYSIDNTNVSSSTEDQGTNIFNCIIKIVNNVGE